MKYINSILCLSVADKWNGSVRWNTTKEEWTKPEYLVVAESDESKMGDYGIETDRILKYHDEELYNVADCVRYYLDMLDAGRFDELKDVFYDYMSTTKIRKELFRMVHRFFIKESNYHAIHNFMTEEFGSAWISYCQQALANQQHVDEAVAEHTAAGGD